MFKVVNYFMFNIGVCIDTNLQSNTMFVLGEIQKVFKGQKVSSLQIIVIDGAKVFWRLNIL